MRLSLIVLSAVVVLSACKKEEGAKASPTTAQKATAVAPVDVKANVDPIEGALAYPFTQADSKLSWVGSKISAKHEGGFGIFGGIIEVVGNDVTKSRVRAEIDMTSVTTSPGKLVEHLKSPDFFAVEEWPRSTFVSTNIVKNGDAYAVTGNLTLRNVTKSITFPAQISITEPEVTVKATFSINRKDFNIIYPGKPDDLIGDDVAIELDLHARKKG